MLSVAISFSFLITFPFLIIVKLCNLYVQWFFIMLQLAFAWIRSATSYYIQSSSATKGEQNLLPHPKTYIIRSSILRSVKFPRVITITWSRHCNIVPMSEVIFSWLSSRYQHEAAMETNEALLLLLPPRPLLLLLLLCLLPFAMTISLILVSGFRTKSYDSKQRDLLHPTYVP